jgi:ADP-ribose pyrophosphatase YjhB (NUDIX family)
MSSTQKGARMVPQAPGQQSEEMAHVSSFAMIKRGNELLLVKKLRPEFTAGKWVLPSSVIYFGEDPEAAMKRIVREQVGTEPKDVKLLQVQSYGDKHWDLCFVYGVSIDGVGKLHPDNEKAEYFDRGKLPPEFRGDHLEVLQNFETKSR